MKPTKLISSAIVGTLLTLAAGASAGDTVFHASVCHPQSASVSQMDYTHFGVHNASASTGWVACGAGIPILATINTVTVRTYDRNPATDVACTLTLTDLFGTSLFSQTKSTTGSGAGSQGLSYSPGVGTHTLTLGCSIPAVSAGNLSHVTSFRVITP